MNIQLSRPSGSALWVTLVLTAVIGVALASHLALVSYHDISTRRSQSWNAALTLAEAGIEEAMAHFQANKGNLGCCGWNGASGTNYTNQRTLGNGYYMVSVSAGSPVTLVSKGFSPVPLTSTYLSRTVAVTLSNYLGAGVQVRDSIDLNGNNVVIDSFDSSNPTNSNNGRYDPARRTANAWVSCNSGVKDAVNVGNADIWGGVTTGPNGSVAIGPNGSVGDLAWHAAGNKGVQPGATNDDAAVVIPDPPPPPTGGIVPAAGTNSSTAYTYFLNNGVYKISGDLSADTYVAGDATLIVSGEVKLESAKLVVANGGSLTLYCYGPVSIGGDQFVNQSGLAKKVMIYGMPTCTQITFNGGTFFAGRILAPQADVKGGGSGGGVLGFSGSVQAKSFTVSGGFQFHYDQSLSTAAGQSYLITSWNEL